MKRLKFAPELISLILSGEKTKTWRFFDDKELSVGDLVEFVNRETKSVFARAELVSVEEKQFGDLESADKYGHELFSSEKEMYAQYSTYYKRPITPDMPVKVIHFRLLH